MSEHADHHGHDHPPTFTDAIARGIPMAEFLAEWKPRRERLGPSALGMVRREIRIRSAFAAQIGRRKDQRTMPVEEQAAFKAAVSRLVSDGTYQELVAHHMDMSHDMHGSMGFDGLLRFLGWHRRYLVEFERELQRVDRQLRPTAIPVSVPYWRWPDPFPTWMDGFLPAKVPDTGGAPPSRRNAAPPEKASEADLALILTGFSAHLPEADVNDYARFTYGLEGFGFRPDGTRLPAHNHGHGWIGGIMNDTRRSPTDPMFWLHHCEVDRLWHIWQQSHGDIHPPLSGTARIMDPWPEAYDDLVDVAALGYGFESVAP